MLFLNHVSLLSGFKIDIFEKILTWSAHINEQEVLLGKSSTFSHHCLAPVVGELMFSYYHLL